MSGSVLDRTAIQRRRGGRWWRWLKIGMVGLLAIVVFLLIAGMIYQAVGAANDARRFPPPGQLVDVGGYKLRIYCVGEGSPTVILDHVADTNAAQWALIQPAVASETRVCAYDRAGFGWSDAGPCLVTAGRTPTSFTPCSKMPAFLALTCWWVIRTARMWCGSMRLSIRMT